MKTPIGWALTVILGTLVAALIVGAFMEVGSGLLPAFLLFALWPAREMTWETEFEIALRTLNERQGNG